MSIETRSQLDVGWLAATVFDLFVNISESVLKLRDNVVAVMF